MTRRWTTAKEVLSPGMLDDASLLRLSDLNLAEATREQARLGEPHAIEERDDLLLGASATRFPAAMFNTVLGVGERGVDPDLAWSRAEGFFRTRERGFGVFVRKHLDGALLETCQARELPQIGDTAGMVLTAAPEAPSLPEGVELVTVTRPDQAAGFVEVSATAFESLGLPPDVTRKVFAHGHRWLSPQWHVRLVMEAGAPVAAAMVLFSHGIAGIYWVGTTPAARGRGHGEAVTRAVSRDAFERGAQAVVLQASPFGDPIYRRIGFREITRYVWFMVTREK